MLDSNENNSFHKNPDCSAHDYLIRADEAVETGNIELGMHLYMAAFERSQQATYTPDDEVVDGLREAWVLACELEERSFAEYIFEKLEPYLTSEEVKICAEELQKLAFGKLERIGLSAEDIADIAHAATREFVEGDEAPAVRIGRIEGPFSLKNDDMSDMLKMLKGLKDSQEKEEPARADDSPETQGESEADSNLAIAENEVFTYDDIAGYTEVIRDMRSLGIGLDADPAFKDFVAMLNARHGLKRVPALDSLLFRSPAREDANEFMLATAGELGHPTVRMRVDENMQGIPVLSIIAQADSELHLNASRTVFEGKGTLVLEDIDLWLPPLPEPEDGLSAMLAVQIARAAREALGVIRTAVENPDIHVLASASAEIEVPAIFLDLLDPFTCVDIDLPTAGERAEIWMGIVERHPSLRQVDRAMLVRYTANMPRVDLYFAAREAIEESYRRGMIAREYIPVTNELMFEKLANFHPLDSDEYRELEEYVAGDFRRRLDREKTVDMFLGLDWEDESEDGGEGDSDSCAIAEASESVAEAHDMTDDASKTFGEDKGNEPDA